MFGTKSKKSNIPPRHRFYLVCIIGIAATLIVYLFPFRGIVEKTQNLNTENEARRLKIINWKAYYANKDIYLEDTANMLEEIERVCDKYPSDAKEEDAVMLAVNLTQKTGVEISNINMSGTNSMYAIPEEEVLERNIEAFMGELEWNEKGVSYVVSGDYETIKNSIKNIYAQKNNIAINQITLSKGEEELLGNIDVSLYSLKGTSKQYTKPDISKYVKGTDNIFGITYEEDSK